MDSPDRPQESQTEPCGMVWGVPGLNWGLFHVCEEQLQQPKHGGDLENEAKQAAFMSAASQMITCVSLFLQIVFLRLLHVFL